MCRLSCRRRSNATELGNRQILHKGQPHFLGDDKEAIRLTVIGGKLRQDGIAERTPNVLPLRELHPQIDRVAPLTGPKASPRSMKRWTRA
jgi:hypothetical protein